MSAFSPPLACSVRNCALPLVPEGARWHCERGHSFDIARSGYLSLLQPQDRRSLEAGDSRETVDARRELLDSGFGAALREELVALVRSLALPAGSLALDLGCGDGHFLAATCDALGLHGLGIDLSPHAVERCARRHDRHAWIAANADRRLPVLDASVDLALSIDGRRPSAEFARVLRASGALVIAVPAADDLVELRTSILGEDRGVARIETVARELSSAFVLREQRLARERVRLGRADLERLARATYRWQREREKERFAALESLEVTTSHDLLLFRRRA